MPFSETNMTRIKHKIQDEEYARVLKNRIRSEMSDAESFFLISNAFWEERFYDTEILCDKKKVYGYEDTYDNDLGFSFNKIYKPNIGNKIDSSLKKYYPIRTFYFDNNKAICNVYGILWDNITTNKGVRDLYIRNDGLFALNKNGNKVSYKIRYDVKDESYSFDIKKHGKFEYIDFSNKKDYIVKKRNNVTFLFNKKTENKVIQFTDYNKENVYSSTYNLFYDENNNLTKLQLLMDIHKENKRLNGSYFIEIDNNTIKPYFISRKGVKTDLREDMDRSLDLSLLLYKEYKDTLNDKDNSVINNNLKLYALDRIIDSFDGLKLNNEVLNNTVKEVINSIDNSIKPYLGEIPFTSLNEHMRRDMDYTKQKTIGNNKSLIR